MKNRLKTRAYHKKRNKMYEVEGLFVYRDDSINDGEVFLFNDECKLDNGDSKSYYFPEEVVLMQCTGIRDKNGTLIYEGDIYHQGDAKIKHIVEWLDTGLKGRQIGNQSYAGLKYWQDKIEIIGNIYENKELLQ